MGPNKLKLSPHLTPTCHILLSMESTTTPSKTPLEATFSDTFAKTTKVLTKPPLAIKNSSSPLRIWKSATEMTSSQPVKLKTLSSNEGISNHEVLISKNLFIAKYPH